MNARDGYLFDERNFDFSKLLLYEEFDPLKIPLVIEKIQKASSCECVQEHRRTWHMIVFSTMRTSLQVFQYEVQQRRGSLFESIIRALDQPRTRIRSRKDIDVIHSEIERPKIGVFYGLQE